ncbi:MAG: hypothetical protein J5842_09170, partial [Lachnospiraceae bacterium]|nr:hypothetical protein [Lachnospiraceae bacterium]
REGRLVRMSNSSRLIETSFDELADVLAQQKDCYEGHIEELFREEDYLISPLTDPDRFLRREYFLTSQQRDIRHHILKRISSPGGAILREFSMSAFTGLPGTGKSILLYDIAMQLSRRESVCLLHIGAYEKELKQLDRRLKRVDFYYCDPLEKLDLEKEYSAILIDEGHRLSADLYEDIINLAEKWQVPVIATFDKEDAVPKENGQVYGGALILETPGCISYKLTNRIRLNSELSSFISSLMRIKGRSHRAAYPSVSLSFANDEKEAARLLCSYVKEGYRYIHNGRTDIDTEGVFVPGPGVGDAASLQGDEGQGALCGIAIDEAVCKEYDKVIMLMDEAFFYDDDGYLRERNTVDDIAGTGARNLYHGLSRAKKRIAIIVKQNTDVFDSLLHVLQTS